ncbi:MAG: hypothetical protein J6S24_10645 [Lentisphaeria bacterium]|nr:hypothetical protein [Lentisphaeria bacterium]
MVINNNNNNNNYPNTQTPSGIPETKQQPVPSAPAPVDVSKFFKNHDRESMIFLAKYFGWSGLHYFHFKKPFLGVIHLLCAVAGGVGFVSLIYLILLVKHPEKYLQIAMWLIPLLFLSALSGVICSLYWSLKDDESFQKSYPAEQQEAESAEEKN